METIGIITNAMSASIKSKLASYKEAAESYIFGQIASEVPPENINFGRGVQNEETGEWYLPDTERSIKYIIDDIDEFYEKRLIIMKGELYYCWIAEYGENPNDDIPMYASQLGIKVLKYGSFTYDGESSVYSNLVSYLYDDLGNVIGTTNYFMCTPDLSGFNVDETYYVNYDKSDPENLSKLEIKGKVNSVYSYTDTWYDYPNKQWANVLTLNNESMTYWVWVPRFAYNPNCFVEETLDGSTYLTMEYDSMNLKYNDLDVVFVDTTNHYKEDGVDKELESGWIVPDGFSFDGQELPGFWMSKFEVQETAGNNGDFYITASVDAIGIITSDSKNTEEYKVYIDNSEQTVWDGVLNTAKGITQLADGTLIKPDTTYLVSIYDHYGIRKWTQSIHTLTYQPESEIYANVSVDISGFNTGSSYFVLYDQNGGNPMLVPFSSGVTSKEGIETYLSGLNIDYNDSDGDGDGYFWYNYGDKRGEGYSWRNFGGSNSTTVYPSGVAKIWANVATIANNSITYWTYVPRYCYYQVGGETSTSFDMRFIPASVTETNIGGEVGTGVVSVDISSNYVIPDAFEFDSKVLNGFWMGKYEVECLNDKPSFYAVVDGRYIQIMNKISSSSANINPGTYYTVTINKVGDTTDFGTSTPRRDNFKTAALLYDTDYEVKVYVNLKTNGSYVKVLQFSETVRTGIEPVNYDYANIVVDLSGYDTTKTLFVLYDGTTQVADSSNTFTLSTLISGGTWTGGSWSGSIFTSTAGKATVTFGSKTYTWFDYPNKYWANVKTIGGGTTSYFTYVPRYAYKLNEITGRIDIKFINTSNKYSNSGIQTTIGSDWTIPDGFTFDGAELSGFWMGKYEVQKYSD